MNNRRMELQRLLNESAKQGRTSSKALKEIKSIVLEDPDYATGFFNSLVTRMLRVLSPVVSKHQKRGFSLEVAIVDVAAKNPKIIFGIAFSPNLGDDVAKLEELLAEEIIGISSMRGFGKLVKAVAVNGSIQFSQ